MQATFFFIQLVIVNSQLWNGLTNAATVSITKLSIQSVCSNDSANVIVLRKQQLKLFAPCDSDVERLKTFVITLSKKNDMDLQLDDIFLICKSFTADVLHAQKHQNVSKLLVYTEKKTNYETHSYFMCIYGDGKASVDASKTDQLRSYLAESENKKELDNLLLSTNGGMLYTVSECMNLRRIIDQIVPETPKPNEEKEANRHQYISILSSGISLAFCISIVMLVIFLRERRKRLITAAQLRQQVSTDNRLSLTNSFSRLASQEEIIQKLEVSPRNVRFRGNKKVFIDRGALSLEFNQIPFFSSEEASRLPIDASEKTRLYSPLPFATTRVKLGRKTSAQSTFINANHVSGFDSDQCFIATQSPLHNTINDFWHMIWEQNCTIVVNLCPKKSVTNMTTTSSEAQENEIEANQDAACNCKNSDDENNYLPEMHSCKCIDNFQVTYRKSDTVCNIDCAEVSTISLTDMETHLRREIRHFRYFGEFSKEKDAPADIDAFIRFVEIVQEEQTSSGAPMVVHCPDGAHICGLFICVSKCIRAVCADGTCDVTRAVLQLRQERPRCLPTVEQYVYLHQVLHTYASKLRDFRQQTSSDA